MAIRDISFYKYLEAAFRHKLFRERDATSFNYLGFNLTYDRIFYYARRVLPSLYSTKFPDTEAGNLQMAASVLQNLDRAQDQELKSYFDPATAPEENIPVIEEATQESTAQQAPAATPVAAGPLPGVGIRPPSIPRMPSVKLGEVSEQLGKTQKTSEPVASAGQTSEVSQPTIRTTRGFNLSGFRPPVSFVNTAKNFGSAAGRFFQRNVGKFFTAGRIASVVSGGIGAIVGAGLTNNHPIGIFGGAGAGAAGSFWIKSGDAARFLGKVGNGAINVGANISNQVSSGATRLSMSSGSKKWALGLLGAFILFFGISLIGNLTGTTPPGQAGPLPPPPGGSGCPDTSGNRNPATCRYLNPSINLFDTNISQSTIDSYVNKYSPIFINAGKGDLVEFKKRVDYIVSNAKAAGLNPAMFLGYWKTESMFSTLGNRDMGCAGDDFYEQVDCALGINAFTNPNTNPIANCAKSKDAGSVACQALKSIRAKAYDLTHPIRYPIATFDDFAEAYGPYDDLVGGQPTNCTHTYNELIDMTKELGACQIVPPPGGIASCPLAGSRTITCGSYGSDPIYNASFCNGPQPEDRGHCGRTYGSYRCSPDSRRAHAIDVAATPGETVYLPTVEGKSVTWNHILEGSVSPADGGGYWHYFGAILGADQWFLYLIHVDASLIGFSGGKDHYESGDPVTTIAATTNPHVHVNIGKNPEGADSGAGWFNPEDIGMCTR